MAGILLIQRFLSGWENKLESGTTTIGLLCSDGVILATDRRATMGSFIAHKAAKKLFRIDDRMGMTIAGVVADAQRIVDIATAEIKLIKYEMKRDISVRSVAVLISNILFGSRIFPYILRAIVGGIDFNGAQMFVIDLYGSVTKESCIATGSGSPYALAILETEYKKEMSVEEALPTAIKAMKAAMSRDTASGNGFDVAIITEEGYREEKGENLKA